MEILNKIPTVEFNLPLAMTILIICIIVSIVIGIIIDYKNRTIGITFFTFLLGLVSGLLIGGIVGDVCEKETGEYYYEIKVDENTKFLDFFDKYEIIEEKSRNIYLVKEVDNVDFQKEENNKEVNIKGEN